MEHKNKFPAKRGKRDTALGHPAIDPKSCSSANECKSSEQPGAVALPLPDDVQIFIPGRGWQTHAPSPLPENAIMFCRGMA